MTQELLTPSSGCHSHFTAVVGNPPYQVLVGATQANNDANSVFHHFYTIARQVGWHASLIFPGGRWMQRSARFGELSEAILPTVAQVTWYANGDEPVGREVFPQARIRDGVAVVYTSRESIPATVLWNGFLIPRPQEGSIHPLQRELTPLALKAKAFNRVSVTSRRSATNFFAVRSYYTSRHPGQVVPIDETPSFPAVKAFLTNAVEGSGKKVREYWLAEEAVRWTPERRAMLTSWKVVATQGGLSKDPQRETYRVVGNEHLVGESLLIVGSFPTREEAVNYSAYLNCPLTKCLLEASKGGKARWWGWFVPDLGDYTSAHPFINWEQPLEPQLYKLLELTPEEVTLVQHR